MSVTKFVPVVMVGVVVVGTSPSSDSSSFFLFLLIPHAK